MPFGWIHEDEDVERTICDVFGDYNWYVRMRESLPRIIHATSQTYYLGGGSGYLKVEIPREMTLSVSNIDNSSALRRFLDETGVISSGEPTMSMTNFVRAFVDISALTKSFWFYTIVFCLFK